MDDGRTGTCGVRLAGSTREDSGYFSSFEFEATPSLVLIIHGPYITPGGFRLQQLSSSAPVSKADFVSGNL